jgi:hypothetical protein
MYGKDSSSYHVDCDAVQLGLQRVIKDADHVTVSNGHPIGSDTYI